MGSRNRVRLPVNDDVEGEVDAGDDSEVSHPLGRGQLLQTNYCLSINARML